MTDCAIPSTSKAHGPIGVVDSVPKAEAPVSSSATAIRDRVAISTIRCGRSNPGSNPGHGSAFWQTLKDTQTKWAASPYEC